MAIFQINKFIFEIEMYFSNIENYNSNQRLIIFQICGNVQLYFGCESTKLCFIWNFNLQICKTLFQVAIYS